MSLATASCDLWQNEQRKISSGDLVFTRLYSLNIIRSSLFSCETASFDPSHTIKREGRSYRFSGLIDDIVYDSVFLRLLRVHDEVALHIFFDLIEFLAAVLGE